MKRRAFFSMLIPGVYVVAVLAALIFMFATAHKTAFCALYAILITEPWSNLILPNVKVSASPTLFGIPLITTLLICVFAAVNSASLYFPGSVFDGLILKHASKDTPGNHDHS